MKDPDKARRDIANLPTDMSLEFAGAFDAQLEPREYWEDEPEEPTCFKCGVQLHTFNEQQRGCCDECWREANEEDT